MVKKTESGNQPSLAGSTKTQNGPGDRNVAMMMFAGAVLDISWQMIIVVLVPVIGGFELDKRFHTTPALTIVGFVLAMLGTFVVLKRAVAEYGDRTVAKTSAAKTKEKK